MTNQSDSKILQCPWCGNPLDAVRLPNGDHLRITASPQEPSIEQINAAPPHQLNAPHPQAAGQPSKRAGAAPAQEADHPATDKCGFDRSASHAAGVYVCTCGWQEADAGEETYKEIRRACDEKLAKFADTIAALQRQVTELRDNGTRLLEAADGWKAQAQHFQKERDEWGRQVAELKERLEDTLSHLEQLRDLLRDEFNRGHRFDSPWDCTESDCPGFKQPMRKSCGCYQDATKAHIAKVLREINQS